MGVRESLQPDPATMEALQRGGLHHESCWVCADESAPPVCEACIQQVEALEGPLRADLQIADARLPNADTGGTLYSAYAAILEENSDPGVQFLGAQAYVTKLLDLRPALEEADAREALLQEFVRLNQEVFTFPVELESIEDGAHVLKGKALISVKNWEDKSSRKYKGRIVAMGNVIFDKFLKVKLNLPQHDLWAPVCTMTAVRVVEARAVAHKRSPESIDLVQAYTQIELGGDIVYYLIVPREVIRLLPRPLRRLFEILKAPVVRLKRALYGIGRAGTDFIRSFHAWLRMNKWNGVPEEPALQYYWQTEDESTVMRRALHLKAQLTKERTESGCNPLLQKLTEGSRGPATWVGTSTTDDSQRLIALKRQAGSADKCAVLATYVDDCDLDAKKQLRSLRWKIIRIYFNSDEPADVQKFLGLVHEPLNLAEAAHAERLSQVAYLQNMLTAWQEGGGTCSRTVRTVGQGGPAPRPEEAEPSPCGTRVRSVLGTLLYAARATRPDLCFALARLARFTDKWNGWAEKELQHI
eukprot:7325114-Lingulodinium_polyedra.AAC.1